MNQNTNRKNMEAETRERTAVKTETGTLRPEGKLQKINQFHSNPVHLRIK